jgi:protein gp37
MGYNSAIEWCDHTFNPWIGCQRVSPGCMHCYAETRDQRFHAGEHWGPKGTRQVTATANWRKPVAWNRVAEAAGRRDRVFCASLADVFEDREDVRDARLYLLDLIRQTPNLDWLLLTKRPEKVMPLLAQAFGDACMADNLPLIDWLEEWISALPPQNVWIGTSVEDQQRAEERIPHLLRIPAAVRFLSCEPLLGPVDFGRLRAWDPFEMYLTGVHWVIVGGESGSGARPMHPDWARQLRDQCQVAGVPFLFKQWGAWLPYRVGVAPLLEPQGGDSVDAHILPAELTDNIGSEVSGWMVDADSMDDDEPTIYRRVGKHAAGRELDGRTWDELPVPA